jgi:hypothetical protein
VGIKMIFRDIYKVMSCDILYVKVGKIKYEYGIFAKEIEGRPYITDLFLSEVLEVKAVGEDEFYIKLKGKKKCSLTN